MAMTEVKIKHLNVILGRKHTHIFLELRISTRQFVIHITGEIFKSRCRKSGKLLPGLIALRMKVLPKGKEGNWKYGNG